MIEQEDQLTYEECIEDESEVFAIEVEALEEIVDTDEVIVQNMKYEIEVDEKKFVRTLPLESPTKATRQPVKQTRKSGNAVIDPADDDKIRSIADMSCEICSKKLESIANARNHFRNEHGVVGYLR